MLLTGGTASPAVLYSNDTANNNAVQHSDKYTVSKKLHP